MNLKQFRLLRPGLPKRNPRQWRMFLNLCLPLCLLPALKGFGQTSLLNRGEVYIGPESEIYIPGELVNRPSAEIINDGQVFLYGDFRNEGLVDFFLGTGVTYFIGNRPQEISGEVSYLQDVVFDNSAAGTAFRLAGEIQVMGSAYFRNGIIDQRNYGGSLTFRSGARQQGASNASHVLGKVLREGNLDFSFPVGNGAVVRAVGISGIPPSEGLYEAVYIQENSAEKYPHSLKADVIQQINDSEYWILEKTGEEEIIINLSWNAATTPDSITATPQKDAIRIVRWDAEKNMWMDEGGEVDASAQTVTTAVSKGGVFTLARVETDRILACDLVIYNAVTPNGDGVNDYFLIDLSNNQCATNLNIQIFNQWGVKVYEEQDYGTGGRLFRGYSNQKLTINGNSKLPTGFYFYVLEYESVDPTSKGQHFTETGYINLSGN